ncbi:MAG: hypothetical protein K0R67_2609 [Paenibacillus sp.]|nr:hypothetical protein [Paenibacillus sp.]
MYDEAILYQNNMLGIKIFEHMKIKEPLLRKWHYHRELELLCILEGAMEMRIQEQVYPLHAGDVLLIGSSQPHATWSVLSDKVVYVILHFDLHVYSDPFVMLYYRIFHEVDGPLSRYNNLFQGNDDLKKEIGSTILSIYREMDSRRRGYEFAISLHIKHLLLTILRCEQDESRDHYDLPFAYKLHSVFDYVERHLSDKIDMEIISKMTNMSYHYFSKFFKKTIGVSFVEFVNIQRIKKAERLLLTENSNITEIALSVGISNMTHFYDLFKRYNHCSPKEYVRRLSK